MTDICSALEKLIEVLQLEGHELFEIFVAAQAVIGIAHIIITLVTIFGSIVGGYYFWECLKKYDYGDEVDRAGIGVLIGAVIGIILLIVSLTLYSGYMHIYYPEYTAAKEILHRLAYLV